jgi:heptosyltransferase-2
MAERILVRAPNWLGDAVMATPFLKRLGEKNPGAVIDVLAKPGLTEIFQGAPGVSGVVPLPPGKNPLALARKIRSRTYDRAYLLPPSFSSALSVWLAGIPQRIGYATDFRSPLLTDARPLDERFHYVRRYLGLLGEPGAPVGTEDLHVPRSTEKELDAFMQTKGGFGNGKTLAVAPGSRAPARRWFPERFAETINGLGTEWESVLLMGAPEDRPIADAVARLTKRKTLNLCGETTLPLAAAILKRANALLTNESGLMHVGWAVGVPLVIAAGPSNPKITSPFGPQVQILQTREVPCVPCVRNECFLRGDAYKLCLKKITAQEAIDRLNEME